MTLEWVRQTDPAKTPKLSRLALKKTKKTKTRFALGSSTPGKNADQCVCGSFLACELVWRLLLPLEIIVLRSLVFIVASEAEWGSCRSGKI